MVAQLETWWHQCGAGWSYVQNTGDVSGKPTIADCNSLLQQINTTGSDNCGTMQVGTCAIVVTDPGGALGCQDVYNLAAYIVATYQDDTTTYTGGEATGTVSLNDGVTVDVNKAVDNSGVDLQSSYMSRLQSSDMSSHMFTLTGYLSAPCKS